MPSGCTYWGFMQCNHESRNPGKSRFCMVYEIMVGTVLDPHSGMSSTPCLSSRVPAKA